VRFVIINTDYANFLESLYEGTPELANASYEEQLAARNDSLFGMADFYSRNRRALGHDAIDLHANNEPLQRAWAGERDIVIPHVEASSRRVLRRALRPFGVGVPARTWFERILEAQVAELQPDVLLVHDMSSIDPRFVAALRAHAGMVVGQHAATRLPHEPGALAVYDLVISSFGPTIEWLRRAGVRAVLNRLAFEPIVLDALPPIIEPTYDVTFVGSLYPGIHDSRIGLLETLSEELGDRLSVWTPQSNLIQADSPLRGRMRGAAYGREMYSVLQASKVTLNEHGSIAPYANNCRLYEATGVGTALVTDMKPNLRDLFDVGKEVVSYSTPAECVAPVRELLDDGDPRSAIARSGQRRTLGEHTYRRRVEELVELIAADGSTLPFHGACPRGALAPLVP
jgi:hypothetical protein